MAYEVLARKWRPQQFDAVVGQEHVTRTLRNAIESGRVAHAYLFVGPRGIGKTSIARILAKALNCLKGPSASPCDDCDACREIMAGNSMDVLEIDGASNNGVDQVRDLRENVRYAPARGPFKIYIIDEVHMLSISAFNALLKTLEEPPAHVKFVLATTEPQKVPSTIASRCQRFDLRRIATPDIMAHLAKIAADEKVTISEDALLAIARGAEGGLRDAESALDQLISFRGRTIEEADVLSVFGLAARATLERLAGAVLAGDVSGLVAAVAELEAQGKDLQRLVLELLEYFRGLLIVRYAGADAAALDLPESQRAVLAEQASGTEPARVQRIAEILIDTENRMRFALSKRTLLEMALIRAARAARTVTVDGLIRRINELKEALGGAELPEEPAPLPGAASPRPAPPRARAAPPVAAAAKPEDPAEKGDADAGDTGDEGPDAAALNRQWPEIADRAGRAAPRLRSALRDAKAVSLTATHLEVGIDPEFAPQLDVLDTARNKSALQKALRKYLGRDVVVSFSVLPDRQPMPSDRPVAPPPPPEAPAAAAPDAEPGKPARPNTRKKLLTNPSVRKMLELFDGTIVDVRE